MTARRCVVPIEIPAVDDQMDVLRRAAERGKEMAFRRDRAFVDPFQHILDELERTQLARIAEYQAFGRSMARIPQERWSVDGVEFPYSSLQELMQAHPVIEGQTVYVAEEIEVDPARFLEADEVIESIVEHAHAELGAATPDLSISVSAKRELSQMLTTWLRKHCHYTSVVKADPYVIKQADLCEDAEQTFAL